MQHLHRLIQDRGGAISLMTALFMGLLVLLIGGVLDFGRAYIVLSNAQGALDSASLAAAEFDLSNPANMASADARAKKYFNVNFKAGSWGTNISADNMNLSLTPASALSTRVEAQLGGGSEMSTHFLQTGSINKLSLRNNSEVTQTRTKSLKYFDINLGANDMPASACSDTQNWVVPVLDGKYTIRAIPLSNFPSKYSNNGASGQFAYAFINGYCRGIGVGAPGEPAPRKPEIDPAVAGLPREGLKVDFGGLKMTSVRIGIRDLYLENCMSLGTCRNFTGTYPGTTRLVEQQYCPAAEAAVQANNLQDYGPSTE
ncbi:MAG: hypothetical protein K2Q12_01320 [Rickettsiales bacterium]|nr:hypothetical protein [Rickettsiales bacterium]